MLRLSKNFLNEQSRKMVYHAHLDSHINYGVLIWGNNASKEQFTKLQRIQTDSLKLIAPRNKSNNLNKELGILPIESKMKLENCKFGYKIKNKYLPNNTLDLCYLDCTNKSLTKHCKYNTWHGALPVLPENKNKIYRNSFLCLGPKLFQTLPVEMQLKPNVKSFTSSCKKYLSSY